MYSNDFEAAFSKFLESRKYDEVENILFSAMRQAFIAGWLAAGGQPPNEGRLYQMIDFTQKKEP